MASMSSWDEPTPPKGGLRNLVRVAIWAAVSLGVFVGALLWSFELGLRSPSDVPALQVALKGEWRSAPADAGGRVIPDQGLSVYDRFDGGAGKGDPVIGAPAAERPTEADREAVRGAGGQSVDADAFLALVAQAVDNPDAAARRRVIDLDLQSPRAGGPAGAGLGRPSAPPNVGLNAEPAEVVSAPPKKKVEKRPAAEPAAAGQGAAGRGGAADQTAAAEASARSASGGSVPKVAEVETVAPDTVIETASASNLGLGAAEDQEATGDEALAPAAEERQVDTVLITPQTKSGSQRPAGPAIYQVQLAALDSVALVEERWKELRALEPTLLGDLELDLQPVEVDDTRLYRLRVGSFSSRDQAAALCSALRDKQIDCFPATK